MAEEPMNPEEIAAEIRHLASPLSGFTFTQRMDEFRKLADRIKPPAPCTIDQVEGWEVQWFRRGSVAVSPRGIVWYSWVRGGVPVVPEGEIRPVLHPWPERPTEATDPTLTPYTIDQVDEE